MTKDEAHKIFYDVWSKIDDYDTPNDAAYEAFNELEQQYSIEDLHYIEDAFLDVIDDGTGVVYKHRKY